MNNSTSNTSASQPAGSATGNKFKGAMEFLHGAGENVRGTALGVVDTVGSTGATKNDEIARQGRLEMERGLGNMRGSNAPRTMGPQSTTTSSDRSQSAATGATGTRPYSTSGQNAPYDGGSGTDARDHHTFPAYPTDGNSRGYGAENQNMASGPTTTYPSHHRDDAISGGPQPEQGQGKRSEQDSMQASHGPADPRTVNQVTI